MILNDNIKQSLIESDKLNDIDVRYSVREIFDHNKKYVTIICNVYSDRKYLLQIEQALKDIIMEQIDVDLKDTLFTFLWRPIYNMHGSFNITWGRYRGKRKNIPDTYFDFVQNQVIQ